MKYLNLNVKLNFLEENLGGGLYNIVLDNSLLDLKLKSDVSKGKINKCNYIKLKYPVTRKPMKLKTNLHIIYLIRD